LPWSGRTVLVAWELRLACAGLSAAAAAPGLLAAVDQHAAAVREALTPRSAEPFGVDIGAMNPAGLDPADPEPAAPGAAGPASAPSLAQLAGYLRGVVDEATEAGWSPPHFGAVPGDPGWTSADWITVRVLSVCALARALAGGPTPAGPPATPA
jgi:hypothetical protein